jgi:hypothetical protein
MTVYEEAVAKIEEMKSQVQATGAVHDELAKAIATIKEGLAKVESEA